MVLPAPAALPPATPPAPVPTGLLILHGNRLELLAETVFEWLARHPLAPLEEETFLVQSNGMAEWLKMELASAHGICAATRVELPARFIWRAYRAVLGRAAVPAVQGMPAPTALTRAMAIPSSKLAPGHWFRSGCSQASSEIPGCSLRSQSMSGPSGR